MSALEGLGTVETVGRSSSSLDRDEEQGTSLEMSRLDINETQSSPAPDVPPASAPDSNDDVATTNDCQVSRSLPPTSPNDSYTSTSTSILDRQPTIPEKSPSTVATTGTTKTTLNVNAEPFIFKRNSTDLASGSTEPPLASNISAAPTPYEHSITAVEDLATPSTPRIVFTSTTGTRLQLRTPTTSPSSSNVKTEETDLKFNDDTPHKPYALIIEAAQAAVTVLHRIGMKCALFGSTAAKLYGASRNPEDVDILIFPGHGLIKDDTQIKEVMVTLDSRFLLKMPRERTKTYRILWFQSVVPHGTNEAERRKKQCKVDILLPGIMSLPNLIYFKNGLRWLFTIPPASTEPIELPVLPFPILLLHKLQGWSDHRVAPESFKRIKHTQDVKDIKQLLSLRNEIDYLVSLAHCYTRSYQFPHNFIPTLQAIWTHPIWFPEEFQTDSKKRVRIFCYYNKECKEQWEQLGFEVEPVEEEIIDELAEVLNVEGIIIN